MSVFDYYISHEDESSGSAPDDRPQPVRRVLPRQDGRLVLRVQGEEILENLTFCPSFVSGANSVPFISLIFT